MSLGITELYYQNGKSSSTNLHEISSFFQNCKTSGKIKKPHIFGHPLLFG